LPLTEEGAKEEERKEVKEKEKEKVAGKHKPIRAH